MIAFLGQRRPAHCAVSATRSSHTCRVSCRAWGEGRRRGGDGGGGSRRIWQRGWGEIGLICGKCKLWPPLSAVSHQRLGLLFANPFGRRKPFVRCGRNTTGGANRILVPNQSASRRFPCGGEGAHRGHPNWGKSAIAHSNSATKRLKSMARIFQEKKGKRRILTCPGS